MGAAVRQVVQIFCEVTFNGNKLAKVQLRVEFECPIAGWVLILLEWNMLAYDAQMAVDGNIFFNGEAYQDVEWNSEEKH